MSRTVKDKRPHLKPVLKVELEEKHAGLRLALAAALVLIAAAAFAYGVSSCSRQASGWTAIEVDAGAGASCGDEFVLLYELGAGEASPTAEKKALTLLYTAAAGRAYQLFHADMAFEGVNNVYTLNQHPNEVLEVDQALYGAFELLESCGNRSLYLAPIYERYDDLFFCGDDGETWDYDPYQNSAVAAEYRELAAYAGDAEQVEVRLLGSGKVQLYVSEAYLAYAEENGIGSFIDFHWMKNAFIADYLAECLVEKGYTHGTLTSYDGFARNLDGRGETYAFNLYDRVDGSVYEAAVLEYSGARSFVFLRDYPLTEMDRWHYYTFAGGGIRSCYLDIQDGCCRSAVPSLLAYSGELGCARLLLEVSPLYIADELDGEALRALAGEGIYSVYGEDYTLVYNDGALRLTQLYDKDGVRYTARYEPYTAS